MILLFDTNAFIWLAIEPRRLSKSARELCADAHNELLLRVVSVWEIAIKVAKGSLNFPEEISDVVEVQRQVNGVIVLPVSLAHALRVRQLPPIHQDPFDRLLIAQTQHEGATIMTSDANIMLYNVPFAKAT